MQITINALAMRSVNHGVGNYISNLLIKLAQSYPRDNFRVFITPFNTDLPDLLKNEKNVSFERINLPRPFRLLWEQLILPFKVQGDDILHCPVHVLPLIKTTKYIVTELDLTFFTEPSRHTIAKQIYFRLMIPWSCKVADKIISISQSTANDLVKILKIPKEKIVVVPLAASNAMRREVDQTKLRKVARRYRLPEKFILFLGVLEPRKNVLGLVEAYNEALTDHNFNLELVIAGSDGYGWNQDQVYDKVNQLMIGKKVHFIGVVEENDKPALYSLADIFIYPSFYEGFGLPVLEAMYCSVPVITSNGSSLEEIAGSAAVLINPYDINEIAAKIKQLSGDRKLRQSLVKRGLERVKQFSWKITAHQTYETYR